MRCCGTAVLFVRVVRCQGTVLQNSGCGAGVQCCRTVAAVPGYSAAELWLRCDCVVRCCSTVLRNGAVVRSCGTTVLQYSPAVRCCGSAAISFCCTVALYDSVVRSRGMDLRYEDGPAVWRCRMVLLYSTAVRSCGTVLPSSPAVRSCGTVRRYSPAARSYPASLCYSPVIQWCGTVLSTSGSGTGLLPGPGSL